jgi:transposase
MKQRKVFRYSEAFKHQVVDEIEIEGASILSIQKKYGIGGSNTIQSWLVKFGKLQSLPKMIRVETPDEKHRIKALEGELRKLKEALIDSQIDKVYAQSKFSVLCEEFNISEAEAENLIKKKPKTKP